MKKYHVAVIGGGASGIVAAISAARRRNTAVICERLPVLGKKVLASGNGRCNLTNDDLEAASYNPSAANLIGSVFKRFGKKEILEFFDCLGLKLYSEKGRVFPVTNQASSVVKVLEMELRRLQVSIELNWEVAGMRSSPEGCIVRSKAGKEIRCERVIIAGGGKSYPALGSNGSCYTFARQFGHTIIAPVPSAVPLVVKDPWCHLLQGQKIPATCSSIIDGRLTNSASGELLFTRYGLSGTTILDVSEPVSIALNRSPKKDVKVCVDLVPFMDKEALQHFLRERNAHGIPKEELLAGILPNKFCALFKDAETDSLLEQLKGKHFAVEATRGWNEAEFTSGGIAVPEVKEHTLESKLQKNVYFCGEILDVQGRRGGYNLAWAWASGYVAGQTL